MILAIVAFIIGLVYGYAKPGKEQRGELFKKGIIYGILLCIVFGVIGVLVGGVFLFVAGAIGIFINVVFLVIMFIIGTFFGDLLETVIKK